VRKIAKYLGYTDHRGMNTYVKKRNLRPPVLASISPGKTDIALKVNAPQPV
jgi:hypothetical protein